MNTNSLNLSYFFFFGNQRQVWLFPAVNMKLHF